MGSVLARCILYCTRDGAPAYQACLGGGISAALGGLFLLCSGDDGFFVLCGVFLLLYGLYAMNVGYKKATADFSPGRHVEWCSSDADIPSGTVGIVVERVVGSDRIRVCFPNRTFLMRPNELRMTDKSPSHTVGGTYTPPTVHHQQPDMQRSPAQMMLQPMQQQAPAVDASWQQQMQPVQQPIPQPSAPPAVVYHATPVPPPTDDNSPAQTAAATELFGRETMTNLLSVAKLQQYAPALRELGCVEVADLADLEESDMMEIGMKKIEIKRLLRNVA
jgi:hypothetical protein